MYKEKQLVGIAKRENNTKRKYLVVNRLQGKHIPVSAKEAFRMFSELAAQVREAYAGERLLLVGFAETATDWSGACHGVRYFIYTDYPGGCFRCGVSVFFGIP